MARVTFDYVPNTAKPFTEADIPFYVISSDTLDESDLAIRFATCLRDLGADDEADYMRDLEPEEACEHFWDVIDDCLPDGYECSSSGGDGACFGIWPTKDRVDECALEYVRACGIPVSDDTFFHYKGVYVFSFGAYGWTRVVAFGSVEDALEAAAAWCADNAPGVFCTEYVNEAYREAIAVAHVIALVSGCDVLDLADACMQHAETDTTYTESGYLLSYEWFVDSFDDLHDLAKWAFENRKVV